MAETMTVRYSRNPLVKGFTAEFSTEFGTEYQILAFEDQSHVMFGVRNVKCSGTDWSHGAFRYAESWREKNDYPPAWNPKTFRQMVDAFVAESKDGE